MLEAGGEKLSEAIDEVKKNIKVLNDEDSINVEDTFRVLEILHSKIEKEQRRKIVELIVQKDKTNLLKLICDKENKNKEESRKDGSRITLSRNIASSRYFWKGELSGFDTIAELLNYAIDQGSPGSVRLLVDRIYSTLHPIYIQGQYLDDTRYVRGYSCSVNGKSITSAKEKEEFFKELLEKVIEKGFTGSLLGMLGGDIAQLILRMSKDKFEACNELQGIYNMTEIAVIRVLQSLVQSQDEKKAEDRKALIKELIEKGATIKEEDIAEKDLMALAGECKVKCPLKGGGKDYIKRKLQENGVNISKVKRKLSQGVIYSIIVELFFHQHEQIYAIAEDIVENKLIFNYYRYEPCDKDKVKELLSDLEQDIEGKVLEVITQLNKAGRAQKNLFSRLVFKEIMLVEPDKGKDSEINVENVEKIIKGCVTIYQEPMQKLVDELREKGVTISEEVMSVLKLVGVDSLELEKSMTSVPENSNVVPSRNIPSSQTEDLTLSSNSRSEKGTSDELRQPSAENSRDLPKIRVTEPAKMAPEVKVLSPAPPSSKVVEEKNKSFMQTSFGQGGESYYNTDVGSSRYYLNIQNSYRMVGMHSLQQGGVLDNIRSRQRGSLKKKPFDDRLPKISYLEDAHCERYREVLLNKIFDYNKFIDPSMLLKGDPSTGMDRSSSSTSSSTSSVTSPRSLNDSRNKSCEDDPYLDGMQDYIEGFELLKKGEKNRAKNKIREAANKGFECGMYAYAIIKFEEAMEGRATKNMLGVDCASQEAVKEAVECVIKSGTSFFPLSSFVLGIMELYNVGSHREVIQLTSQKSWKMHFADVLRSTKGTPLSSSIVESKLLGLTGADNLDFTEPNNYLEIVGKEEGMKELELMVQQVKYELAKEMVSNKKESITVGHLFRQLSDESFIDAQYSYAVALFNGRLNQVEKEKEVYSLLSKAASCKHPEAMLLLGILPFKKGYEFVKSNNYWGYLENYINLTFDSKDLRQNYLKEKVSVFVAHEYINKNSTYVQYNEQKARGILQRNCDKNQLEKLEKAIKESKECSQSLLNDVLETLKHMVCVLKNNDSYDQELSAMLEQLRRKLKSSKITVQQSQHLLLVLQQLNIVLSIDKGSILSLQQLCEALKKEVEKQSHCSSQVEEILQLLGNLDEVCSALRKERSSNFSSSIDTTSNSTAQLLHTGPVKDGGSMSESRDRGNIIEGYDVKDEILKTLRLIVHVLQGDKSNGKSDAQKLSDMLEQLREELENSEMTIQQSSELSSMLKNLADAKFNSKKDFSQLQHLCYFLEEKVSDEQGKVLSLLEELQEELINILKVMRSGSSTSYCKVSSSLSFSNTGYMLPKSSNKGPQAHSTAVDLQGNMHQSFEDEFLGINTALSSKEQLLCAEQEFEKSRVESMKDEDLEGSFYSDMIALSSTGKGLFESRRASFFVSKNFGDDIVGDYLNAGVKLAKKGQVKDADKVFDDVFEKRESGGYSSYSKLKVLHNKAELYRIQGEDEKLLEVYKKIYAKLGCNNLSSLLAVRGIAEVFLKQDKFDDALRPLQEMYCAQKEILGDDHPSVISISKDIQTVLEAQKSKCSTQLFQEREKGKRGYNSSSNTSGFGSNFTALSDVQNTSEGDKVIDSGSNPSSASGGARQKQNLYSLQQDVSKSNKKWSSNVKPKKTGHSSKSKVGATGSIPSLGKHTSKEQERREGKNKVNSCGRGGGK